MFNWRSGAYILLAKWRVLSTTLMGYWWSYKRVKFIFLLLLLPLSQVMLPRLRCPSSHNSLKVVKLLLNGSVSDKARFFPLGLRSWLGPAACSLLLGSSSHPLLCLFFLMRSVGVCSSRAGSTTPKRAVMQVYGLLLFSLSWLHTARGKHHVSIIYARFLCTVLDWALREI